MELTLLKKNEIKHEIRMTHLKLTEENEKKQDFRHWSDAGREWARNRTSGHGIKQISKSQKRKNFI